MAASTSNIDFSLWLGDEPTVRFTVTDAQGTLDLTAATVTFRWIDRDLVGPLVSSSMTIVETGPTPDPIVSVTFTTGQLAVEELYFYEIRIVDGGGNQLTVPSPPDRKLFRVSARAVPGA